MMDQDELNRSYTLNVLHLSSAFRHITKYNDFQYRLFSFENSFVKLNKRIPFEKAGSCLHGVFSSHENRVLNVYTRSPWRVYTACIC